MSGSLPGADGRGRAVNAAFDFLRGLARERTGLELGADKGYLLETRLWELLRREALPSYDALVAVLRARPHGPLATEVVESLLTSETFFFRDPGTFEVLRRAVLPALIERRRAERRLRIWCGASATGQEPYSVAMLLAELGDRLAGWDVEVLATDVSGRALAYAERGRYSQLEVNRGLPARLLTRYFERDALEWEVRGSVRARCRFTQLNLIEGWPALPPIDVALLRNVLIYFDSATKRAVLGRLRKALRPDGYVFLGGAETTYNLDEGFEWARFDGGGCYRLRVRPEEETCAVP